MADIFTVDRQSTLKPGSILELTKYDDVRPPELHVHADSMFPEGFSRHGEQYFLQNSTLANVATPAIELLFEYVRRAEFPEKPSRFQSWFGVASVVDAVEFRNRYCDGMGAIWRVAPHTAFRVNMALLSLGGTTLVCSWQAHAYWRGEAGPIEPFWEYLLVPPIRVVEAVESSGSRKVGQAGA